MAREQSREEDQQLQVLCSSQNRLRESGDPHKRETGSPTSVLSQHRPFVLDYSGTFLVLCMVNRLSLSLSYVRGLTTQRALFWLQALQRTSPRFVYTKGQWPNHPRCIMQGLATGKVTSNDLDFLNAFQTPPQTLEGEALQFH